MGFDKSSIDYSLYFVTDRDLMSTDTLEEAVSAAIAGGATVVQLREKTASSLAFLEVAQSIKAICDEHDVPLIINDRIDIALAVGAAGVHVGQSDIPADIVRKVIGPDMLLGVSAANLAEARKAVDDGADYLGVGAMFVTATKTDADFTSIDELKRIRAEVDIPIVVIGGINAERIPLFKGTGIDGLAIVSAIIAQPDIEQAARNLKMLFEKNR
ncbi:MAG: thiamine phosphate synthase [Actinomycetota bacterium]|nr:thiamine phosphate synthase [Actinomycetota bacterium]